MSTDSEGLFSGEVFHVYINATSVMDLSHAFMVSLDVNYHNFSSATNNVIDVVNKIGNYFGDGGSSYVTVSSVEAGSTVITWSNNSVSRLICENETIFYLYSKMLDSQGQINSSFQDALSQYMVLDVTLTWLGVCIPGVVIIIKPGVGVAVGSLLDTWAIILIPAVAIALILLIIGCICCVQYRRKRIAGKRLFADDKPTFVYPPKPVILPDEVELQELDSKPKRPLLLLAESPPPSPEPSRPNRRMPPPYQYPHFDWSGMDTSDFSSPPPSYHSGSMRMRPPGRPPPVYKLPPPYIAQSESSEV